MKNPISEFEHNFALWLAVVMMMPTKIFYDFYSFFLDYPFEYGEKEFSELFWLNLNSGWMLMQPDIIEHLDELNSFCEE